MTQFLQYWKPKKNVRNTSNKNIYQPHHHQQFRPENSNAPKAIYADVPSPQCNTTNIRNISRYIEFLISERNIKVNKNVVGKSGMPVFRNWTTFKVETEHYTEDHRGETTVTTCSIETISMGNQLIKILTTTVNNGMTKFNLSNFSPSLFHTTANGQTKQTAQGSTVLQITKSFVIFRYSRIKIKSNQIYSCRTFGWIIYDYRRWIS